MTALTAITALTVILAPSANGDHPGPAPCFDGKPAHEDHDGIHAFHLTGAAATLQTAENDPRLGPYQDKTIDLSAVGPTIVNATIVDTDSTEMATEILEMDLFGYEPDMGVVFYVAESRNDTSDGMITADASDCFDGIVNSHFNVYVEVVAPFPAHSHDAKFMSTTLDDIPPTAGTTYEDPTPLALYAGPSHPGPHDSLVEGPPVAWIHAAAHTPTPLCQDGADNDGDDEADYPDDPGCDSLWDNDEISACDDGIDNDGDGLTDHPDDPGCSSPADDSEFNSTPMGGGGPGPSGGNVGGVVLGPSGIVEALAPHAVALGVLAALSVLLVAEARQTRRKR